MKYIPKDKETLEMLSSSLTLLQRATSMAFKIINHSLSL